MESNEKLDRIFFALADSKRRHVLSLLFEGPVTVSELGKQFESTLATVSKNISLLEKAGLVYKIKKGRSVYCHLNHDSWREIETYVTRLARFWQNRLDGLEQYIEGTGKHN